MLFDGIASPLCNPYNAAMIATMASLKLEHRKTNPNKYYMVTFASFRGCGNEGESFKKFAMPYAIMLLLTHFRTILNITFT